MGQGRNCGNLEESGMDVVTFGETMVQLVPEQMGPLRFAQTFSKTIGGAESNVAIGLARLGHTVGWFGRLGQDEFGLFVRNFIRGEGVDTSRVQFDHEYGTGVFFKERKAYGDPNIYYYRKYSAGSRLAPDDIDENYLAEATYLHVTGITPALSPSARDAVYYAIDVAKSHGVTIVFDPNLRRKLWNDAEARAVLMDVARQCHIVLPGLDEGRFLTGESSPEAIAAAFLQIGAEIVVVKLGAEGAYYESGDRRGIISGTAVERVVDPTGAGDAFAAGFLAGCLRGWDLPAAVAFANHMGAHAVAVLGDIEGIPVWDMSLGGDQHAR